MSSSYTAKSLIIYELLFCGHHYEYVENLIKIALKYYDIVYVVLAAANDQQLLSLQSLLKLNPHRVKLDFVRDDLLNNLLRKLGQRMSEIANWRLFNAHYNKLSRTSDNPVVWLSFLDCVAGAIALLGSPCGTAPIIALNIQNICITAIENQSLSSKIKKSLDIYIYHRLFRQQPMLRIYTIDPFLVREFTAHPVKAFDKLVFIHDPVDLQPSRLDIEYGKELLGIPGNRIVILVYGAISMRKGVVDLIDAVESSDNGGQFCVVIAGAIDDSMAAVFDSVRYQALIQSGSLLLLNRFISKKEEGILFDLTDIVWVGYKKHIASSGVLTLAMVSGKPVIATNKGVIGRLCTEKHLGCVVDIENQHEIIIALDFLKHNENRTLYNKNQSLFSKDHCWSAFEKRFMSYNSATDRH